MIRSPIGSRRTDERKLRFGCLETVFLESLTLLGFPGNDQLGEMHRIRSPHKTHSLLSILRAPFSVYPNSVPLGAFVVRS
jgi:hypothetical protein